MTCNCTHGCTSEADGSGFTPTLCSICGLMNTLNSPDHQLPFAPPAEEKLVPLEPISNAQKDRAISDVVSELGL